MALDADTGRLRWHYQFTPHDVWGWDATQMPVLADLTIGGQPQKVVMFANRNGFFYLLDGATGKLIRARPFIENELGEGDSGQRPPHAAPEQDPKRRGDASVSRSDWRDQLDAPVVR